MRLEGLENGHVMTRFCETESDAHMRLADIYEGAIRRGWKPSEGTLVEELPWPTQVKPAA